MYPTEDERRRRLIEKGILDERGVLRDGFSMRTSMFFADAAPYGDNLKDGKMSTNINDAINQLPSEFRTKMRYAIGMMNDSGGRAENGLRLARNLVAQMQMAKDGFNGMVTDSDKSALIMCADHLSGFAAVAQRRLNSEGA